MAMPLARWRLYRRRAADFLKVKMVGNQSPCKTAGAGIGQHLAQPAEKFLPIDIVLEYFPTFDTSYDDMVQRTRSVYAGLAWHVLRPITSIRK
jgi:hypothetical protein